MRRVGELSPVVAAALLFCLPAVAFETNGRHWDEMPIEYYVNPENCPIIQGELGEQLTIVDIMAMVTETWSSVACADISFQYMGTTEEEWVADGKSTVYCVNSGEMFEFGEGAAGATLWLTGIGEKPAEVDLALNALELEWAWGGGDALTADVMDPVAMITHELGHWLGLAHTQDPYGTMYYALLPNGIQKTLSADDKAGVCSLYPNGTEECETNDECPEEYECVTIEGIGVCAEPHDGPGEFCGKDYINCDEICWVSFYECSQICLFTMLDYSEGFCSPLCDVENDECPEGLECVYIEEHDIGVCNTDPDYVLEPSPEPAVEFVEFVETAEKVEAFELVEQVGDLVLPGEVSAELPAPEPEKDIPANPEPAVDAGKSDSGNGSSGCNFALPPQSGILPLIMLAVLVFGGFALKPRRIARL